MSSIRKIQFVPRLLTPRGEGRAFKMSVATINDIAYLFKKRGLINKFFDCLQVPYPSIIKVEYYPCRGYVRLINQTTSIFMERIAGIGSETTRTKEKYFLNVIYPVLNKYNEVKGENLKSGQEYSEFINGTLTHVNREVLASILTALPHRTTHVHPKKPARPLTAKEYYSWGPEWGIRQWPPRD